MNEIMNPTVSDQVYVVEYFDSWVSRDEKVKVYGPFDIVDAYEKVAEIAADESRMSGYGADMRWRNGFGSEPVKQYNGYMHVIAAWSEEQSDGTLWVKLANSDLDLDGMEFFFNNPFDREDDMVKGLQKRRNKAASDVKEVNQVKHLVCYGRAEILGNKKRANRFERRDAKREIEEQMYA